MKENEIPENYYQKEKLVESWTNGHSLHYVLSNIKWYKRYKYGEWDCTERAGVMEFIAENMGHKAKIGCNSTHCWVLVLFEDGWRAYDSMTMWEGKDWNKSTYYPKNYIHRYNPPVTYQSIYQVNIWEYDWWNVVGFSKPFYLPQDKYFERSNICQHQEKMRHGTNLYRAVCQQ